MERKHRFCMQVQLFINYRQDDSADFTEYLRSRLADEMMEGAVFLDKASIAYGQGVQDSIWQALEAAQMLLVMARPQWRDVLDDDGDRRLLHPQDWVRIEIEATQRQGKDIFLILYNQPDFKETAAWLRNKIPSLAFLGEKKYFCCHEATQQTDVDRLIAELRKQPGLRFRPAGTVGTPPPPPTLRKQLEAEFPLPPNHPLPPARQPFKALHYFERQDARIFFGRMTETLMLCRAVARFPLVLLYGQWGTGKSSLLNAGLLPRIEARFTTHYLRRLREPGLPAQILAWRDSYQPGGKPPLLLLDQVEEMYTHPRPDRREEAEALAPLLKELLAELPVLHLLLAFRSEHIAPIKALLAAQGLIPSRDQEHYLQALDAAGVREALAASLPTRPSATTSG
ncbi:MAG: hypothetical protein OHK0039_49280 [Bacteroidia bacterium]